MSNKSNQQQISVAVAGPGAVAVTVYNDAPPEMFKLNIDCLDMIFDYLSLKDIHTMSQTCKGMQQLAGYYFQQHLPDAVGILVRIEVSENLYIKTYGAIGDIRDDFSQFLNKFEIQCPVRQIMKAESFSSIKNLKLWSDFDSTQLSYVKDILGNIETLDLRSIITSDELFEQMINNCTKLKSLRVNCNSSRRIAIIQNWIQRNPTLEFLGLHEHQGINAENIRLIPILKQNPNLKHLEISAQVLWLHRNSFVKENIHLDFLIIRFENYCAPSRELANLLLNLNEYGIYKKLFLHAFSEEYYQEFINQVASISALQIMAVGHLHYNVDLSPLVNLKGLRISRIISNVGLEILAKNLVNLERISMTRASTDILIPFLRHSKKLKLIKVWVLDDLNAYGILDLAALNMQRQKLSGAHKVSIGVLEKVYLRTKWATKKWNFNLVEIKRYESIDMDISTNF